MISMTLMHLDEKEEFEAMFAKLAEKHNQMGVRAADYAIFADVLLWCACVCVSVCVCVCVCVHVCMCVCIYVRMYICI